VRNENTCFKYGRIDDKPQAAARRLGLRRVPNAHIPGGENLEVHFGKPVVARVRKCRLVIVKNKRPQDPEDEDQPKN